MARDYTSTKLREQYIVSHAILRQTLASYLKIRPAEVKYQYSRYAKPSLSEEFAKINPLFFNMSHSGDFAIYAFSKQPVGIDIQIIKPLRDLDVLVDYVLTSVFKGH